jgi:DNA-binding response OmpR family regulator
MSAPTALIIEDDPDLGVIFSHTLKMIGFDTELIPDGLQGLWRLQASQPDVVILDLHLPGLSGDQILAAARADQHLKDTPIIVVSADSEMARDIREQADLVLIKPVTIGQLQAFVQRLVTRPDPAGQG